MKQRQMKLKKKLAYWVSAWLSPMPSRPCPLPTCRHLAPPHGCNAASTDRRHHLPAAAAAATTTTRPHIIITIAPAQQWWEFGSKTHHVASLLITRPPPTALPPPPKNRGDCLCYPPAAGKRHGDGYVPGRETGNARGADAQAGVAGGGGGRREEGGGMRAWTPPVHVGR